MKKSVVHGGRWGYMADPKFNPPREGCPSCPDKSKIFYIGTRPTDQGTEHTYECEHRHRWTVIK